MVAPGQRVIAEVHVKAVSAQPSRRCREALRGSYAALAHPALIAHWRRLGVTTLELLPVQQRADEARLQALGLSNHWGYSDHRLFRRRAGLLERPARQQHPRANCARPSPRLREAGFEVVLDVVFNHTAETDEDWPDAQLSRPGQPAVLPGGSGRARPTT